MDMLSSGRVKKCHFIVTFFIVFGAEKSSSQACSDLKDNLDDCCILESIFPIRTELTSTHPFMNVVLIMAKFSNWR